MTCQRPWVTDRYFLRTSSGSLSPITVSELKSRSRRRSRATSPATAGRSLSPTECPCRPTTTPVSVWGCRLTVSTSPRSTRRIGLDAEFVVVTWFGNEGQVGWGSKVVTFNYYENVQNAFETAPHYKLAMDGIPGPKWFLAHSLGNMLTSAAIQDFGMPHRRYFMLNAAIAMEAFDPAGGITTDSHDNMTPRAWANYADRVRSTHWFERFPEGDGRRLLTWKGRFCNVTNVVNFYSSEEEVLNDGDGESHNLAERLYVWYNQETRKGSWPFMLHKYEGGWEFNAHYDTATNFWIGGGLSAGRIDCRQRPRTCCRMPSSRSIHSSSTSAIRKCTRRRMEPWLHVTILIERKCWPMRYLLNRTPWERMLLWCKTLIATARIVLRSYLIITWQ